MYKVLVDKRVEKQIFTLHPQDQEKIIKEIDSLPHESSSPKISPRLKKLTGEPNAWRLRVGSLRILFYRDNKEKTLKVYRVGYRRRVY